MSINRIPFTGIPIKPEEAERNHVEACTLPLETFLPVPADWERLQQRMCILVQRILCCHFAFLQKAGTDVPKHIEHEYSKESMRKSHIVSPRFVYRNAFLTFLTMKP